MIWAAIVTDQFRILNANNFVETVENSANSYYVVVGLVNPTTPIVGFGRSENIGIQKHQILWIILIIQIMLVIQ